MKSAPFEYLRVGSRAEAVAALEQHGDAAKVLAGGQSLLTLMNLRVAQPEILVDIGRANLAGIASDGVVEIGAMTTQNAALVSPAVATAAPLMAHALHHVGHHTLRNRGTVGGSIAHADPSAELPAVLVALRGEVVLESSRGTRTVSADEFFVSHYVTVIEDDELLTTVRLPATAPDAWAFYELARRHGDFPLAGAAATFEMGADGLVSSARVVLFSVDERPLRVPEVEAAFVGRPCGDHDAAAEAADLAAAAASPTADIHGTTQFRKRMTGVVLRRAVAAVKTNRSEV